MQISALYIAPANGYSPLPPPPVPPTSQVRPVGRRRPQDVVMANEVASIKDVSRKDSWIFGEVAEGNVSVAGLLQLVLQDDTIAR